MIQRNFAYLRHQTVGFGAIAPASPRYKRKPAIFSNVET